MPPQALCNQKSQLFPPPAAIPTLTSALSTAGAASGKPERHPAAAGRVAIPWATAVQEAPRLDCKSWHCSAER